MTSKNKDEIAEINQILAKVHNISFQVGNTQDRVRMEEVFSGKWILRYLSDKDIKRLHELCDYD